MTQTPPFVPPQVQDAAHGHELAPVLSAVTRAGDGLLEFWSDRDRLDVAEKRAGDFVSAADRQTEQMLRDTLCRPGDHWLGEETHSPSPLRKMPRASGSLTRWMERQISCAGSDIGQFRSHCRWTACGCWGLSMIRYGAKPSMRCAGQGRF